MKAVQILVVYQVIYIRRQLNEKYRQKYKNLKPKEFTQINAKRKLKEIK